MDLLPCPFCGEMSKLTVLDAAVDIDPAFTVICDECQAGGPIDDTREQAVANWNRRPTSTLAIDGPPTGALGAWARQLKADPSYPQLSDGDVDELSRARERRDLAGLPSLTTAAEADGLSMDFDLGGDKPRKR